MPQRCPPTPTLPSGEGRGGAYAILRIHTALPEAQPLRHAPWRDARMEIGKLTIDPLAIGALVGFGSLLLIMFGLAIFIWMKAGKKPGEL